MLAVIEYSRLCPPPTFMTIYVVFIDLSEQKIMINLQIEHCWLLVQTKGFPNKFNHFAVRNQHLRSGLSGEGVKHRVRDGGDMNIGPFDFLGKAIKTIQIG